MEGGLRYVADYLAKRGCEHSVADTVLYMARGGELGCMVAGCRSTGGPPPGPTRRAQPFSISALRTNFFARRTVSDEM